MTNTSLSNEEIRRYSRHLILPEFGMEGQRRLKEGSVLLIGTGGLGSPLALYLAAAGVGHIGLVDFDVVDESNLQRKIAHGTSTVGVRKTEAAKRRLNDLNPNVEVTTYEEQVTSENAFELMRPYDVIVDGTDNFPTRYLTNDASVMLGKQLYNEQGQLRSFVNIYVGDEDIRYLQGVETLVPDGETVSIIPAIAGGIGH